MAFQPETSTYDAGVFQLETTTPVQGGVGGASNSPLLNLANRTRYLKDHVDALEAAATGNAPLNSPAFTGSPTAPNVTSGDSSTKLANTAFVQNATGGITSKNVAGGVNVNLTAAECGAAQLEFTGLLTANISVIVPATARSWVVRNKTTGAFTLTVKTAAGTGIAVTQGKGVELACDGTNVVLSTDDLASVALTGDPTAPTAPSGDNDLSIANTAFVFNAASGMATQSVAGGADVALTAVQAGSALIKLTGLLTANINVTVPAATGRWYVLNETTGDFTVTFKPVGGTGVVVDQGSTTSVASDGSVMRRARRAGFLNGESTFAAGGTMTAANLGTEVYCGGAGSYTLTLPKISASPAGATLMIFSAVNAVTISRQGADTITVGGSTVNSILLNAGDTLHLVSNGTTWVAFGGSAQLQYSGAFGASLGSNGYQKLPGGLILQWGSLSLPAANTIQTVTLPIAFPTGFRFVAISGAAGYVTNSVSDGGAYASPVTASTFSVVNAWDGGLSPATIYWFAIGY